MTADTPRPKRRFPRSHSERWTFHADELAPDWLRHPGARNMWIYTNKGERTEHRPRALIFVRTLSTVGGRRTERKLP